MLSRCYDEAIETLIHLDERCQKGEGALWLALQFLSWAYAEFGEIEKARVYQAEAVKHNPALSLEFISRMIQWEDPGILERELVARRKAGLREMTPKGVQ